MTYILKKIFSKGLWDLFSPYKFPCHEQRHSFILFHWSSGTQSSEYSVIICINDIKMYLPLKTIFWSQSRSAFLCSTFSWFRGTWGAKDLSNSHGEKVPVNIKVGLIFHCEKASRPLWDRSMKTPPLLEGQGGIHQGVARLSQGGL